MLHPRLQGDASIASNGYLRVYQPTMFVNFIVVSNGGYSPRMANVGCQFMDENWLVVLAVSIFPFVRWVVNNGYIMFVEHVNGIPITCLFESLHVEVAFGFAMAPQIDTFHHAAAAAPMCDGWSVV